MFSKYLPKNSKVVKYSLDTAKSRAILPKTTKNNYILPVPNQRYLSTTIQNSSLDPNDHQQSRESRETSSKNENLKRQRRRVLAHFRQHAIQNSANQTNELVPIYKFSNRLPMKRDTLIDTALWLYEYLPIRLAQQIVKFRKLPFIIGCKEEIQEVHEQYIHSYHKLALSPQIYHTDKEIKWENVLKFTNTLEHLLDGHTDNLALLIDGFSDVATFAKKDKATAFMNDMLAARLTTRLICDHHIKCVKLYLKQLENPNLHKNETMVGIFDQKFDPQELVQSVFDNQCDICMEEYGTTPSISIRYYKSTSELQYPSNFKYVPQPLEYVLKEVIKNGMRAHVLANQNKYGISSNIMIPIKCLIVQNEFDFIIKLSDRGMGVPHDKVEAIWGYGYGQSDEEVASTNHTENQEKMTEFEGLGSSASVNKSMHGYGCGLPIAKIYVERMGGKITMESIQGYGTDVYIRMPYIKNQRTEENHKSSNDIYPALEL